MAVMFCNNISLQIREQKGNKWPLLSILLSNNSGRQGLGDSRWSKIKERMKLKALIFALEYFLPLQRPTFAIALCVCVFDVT